MRRLPALATALAAAALAAVPTTLASMSHAEPGEVPLRTEQVPESSLQEEDVDDAAELFGRLWKLPGFAQVEVDYDDNLVIVRWGGEVPVDVEEARARVPEGIRVDIVSVTYSEDEILSAAEHVVESGVIAAQGFRFSSAVANPDYSALVLEVVGSEQNKGEESLLAAARELTDVPLIVKVVERGSFIASRLNDSSPWQGGGLTRPSGCTIGFAVTTSSGQGRLLSAAHCDSYAANPVRDGKNDPIAPASNVRVHRALDTLLIDPSASPATIGKVFGGPWNAGTGHGRYQLRVANANTPALGHQRICTSGATTGEHCGMTIRDTSGLFRATRPQLSNVVGSALVATTPR